VNKLVKRLFLVMIVCEISFFGIAFFLMHLGKWGVLWESLIAT
jgi:hypothetical protein